MEGRDVVGHDSRAIVEGLERASLALVHVGPDGRVQFASPSAESLFGLMAGLDLSHPPPCADPRSPLASLISLWEAKGGETQAGETALIRAKVDGASIFLWVETVPIESGRPSERLFLVLDLTRHLTGSEPIRRLVSQLAHDLRSPLTSISGATELLLSGRVGALAEVQKKLVRIVDEGSGKMAAIISKAAEEGREGGTAS